MFQRLETLLYAIQHSMVLMTKLNLNYHKLNSWSNSYKGYEATVDLNNGTVYGRLLADTIIENVKYKDLNTILTKVNHN
jgi:hypothetical protein